MQRKFTQNILAVILGVALIAPSNVFANAGVPMLALAWPAQWLALIPIILLECEICRRALQLSFRQLIKPVSSANLISTLIGIPLAWIAMLGLEFAVGIAGFSLLPKETEIPIYIQYLIFPFMSAWVAADNVWQVYFAFVILTVPFCIVSILIEERVLRRAFPNQPASTIHDFTRRANIMSYGLLSFIALLFPLLS